MQEPCLYLYLRDAIDSVLIWIDEDRGDGESQEDKGAQQGHLPHRDEPDGHHEDRIFLFFMKLEV